MTTATAIKEQASQILIQREAERVLARRRLIPFCKYTKKDYMEAVHLNILAEKLEAVERGEILRLIITMPPQHGKSETTSVRFPVYALGKKPDRHIVQSSYADSLALLHSRQARDVFNSPEFHELYPFIASRDLEKKNGIEPSRAAHEWETNVGGSYYAVGVGGGLTGRNFDIGIIDDPVKDYASAKSKVVRDSVYDWYTTVFRTRCRPGAAIVILMTRWHQDDLVGRLLADAEADEKADQWDVLNLPAINEQGQALWPERYDIDYLTNTQVVLGSYKFSALYQNSPKPPGGNKFKREWFEIIEEEPVGLTKVRSWDMAATKEDESENNDPDWTVGLELGQSRDGLYYVCDVRKLRGTPLENEKLLKQTAILDGKRTRIRIEKEGGSSGKSIIAYYVRILAGWVVNGVSSRQDKELRADAVRAQSEAGNVKLIKAPWNKAFLDELEMFPNGDHDDQVDALSGAFEELTGSANKPFMIG